MAGAWRTKVRRAVLCVVVALLLPAVVAAQAVTGTILGVITDSTGAVMPGATVTLTNTGTGLVRAVTTDANGEYTAPSLPTGKYTVKAELSGFKTVTVPDVTLGVDQHFRLNLKLEIGAVEESVTVTGASPLIQTSTSELGTTVSEEQIKTLPLNGRNFVNLTRTVPGVVRGVPGANIDGAGSLAWRASASFSANGQRPRDNNYMLDGVDNNETWLQTVVLFPSVDALDEFKLQTSTYSAEFGRSLGGVVNLQIKSGANEMHGSAFEFLRNSKFDENNYFNDLAGRPKPDFSQHQYGGTISGPIVKDKTFYFFDYQGYHVNQGASYLSTVPSAKMRAGDFSELNRVIYDPITHLPFPGNVIPASRFDPAAKNILNQLIPEADTAGTRSATGQTINNYLINPTLERQDNQIDLKVDHSLTSNNRFFGRYSYEKTHRVLPATLPHGDAGFTFGAGEGDIKAQGFAFNDTHTFSSNLLNEFRVGWSSIKFFMTPIDYGTNIAQAVGIPGINLGETTSAMSQIMFNNGGMRNLGANSNQPLITNQNDIQIFDNVTKVAGKHTVKVGGSYTHRSREILNADTIVGRFDFNQNLTSSCGGITSGCTAAANTGFDFASFLLGYASNASRTLFDPGTYTELRPEFAAYLQDDIRVTNRLTRQRRPALGHVRAVGREGQQAVQLRRLDRAIRRRLRQRDDQRRPGGPLSADLLEDRFRTAARLRLRRHRQRQDGRPRRLRPVLELHARRHLVVEGAEPAVPPGAGDDHELRHQHHPVAGAGRASRRQPHRGARRVDAIGVPRGFPRRPRAQLQRQRAAAGRHQLHDRGGLLGIADHGRGS